MVLLAEVESALRACIKERIPEMTRNELREGTFCGMCRHHTENAMRIRLRIVLGVSGVYVGIENRGSFETRVSIEWDEED